MCNIYCSVVNESLKTQSAMMIFQIHHGCQQQLLPHFSFEGSKETLGLSDGCKSMFKQLLYSWRQDMGDHQR